MNESALPGRLNGYPSTELCFFPAILAQGNMGWPFQDSVIFPGFWHIGKFGGGKKYASPCTIKCFLKKSTTGTGARIFIQL